MDNVEKFEMTLDAAGEALELKEGISTFGLRKAVPASYGGDLKYVPDPDNSQNTIFWLRAPDAAGQTVEVRLTYGEM